MAKNTLNDLNNHLFMALERLNEEGLTEEQVAQEVKRAKAVKELGTVIVDNARVQLDAAKHKAEYFHLYDGGTERMPELLERKR